MKDMYICVSFTSRWDHSHDRKLRISRTKAILRTVRIYSLTVDDLSQYTCTVLYVRTYGCMHTVWMYTAVWAKLGMTLHRGIVFATSCNLHQYVWILHIKMSEPVHFLHKSSLVSYSVCKDHRKAVLTVENGLKSQSGHCVECVYVGGLTPIQHSIL
jgi:hypothetical protein